MTIDSLGNSLTETIQGSDLPSVIEDLGEVAIDALIKDGVLKDVPIISTLHGLWKTGVTIRDHIFVQKLLKFLTELAEVPHAERVGMIERLAQESSYRERVGEEIILLLDKLDRLEKAKLVGRAFAAYCKGQINSEILERLITAIDRIALRDLPILKQFCGKPNSVKDIIAQNFVSAGLAYIPSAMASTEIRPNLDLCRVFIRYILKDDKEAEGKV